MTYRIESDVPLNSDGLPAKAFKPHDDSVSAAVATAIEVMDDPTEQGVRVIGVATGDVVWRSTDETSAIGKTMG